MYVLATFDAGSLILYFWLSGSGSPWCRFFGIFITGWQLHSPSWLIWSISDFVVKNCEWNPPGVSLTVISPLLDGFDYRFRKLGKGSFWAMRADMTIWEGTDDDKLWLRISNLPKGKIGFWSLNYYYLLVELNKLVASMVLFWLLLIPCDSSFCWLA